MSDDRIAEALGIAALSERVTTLETTVYGEDISADQRQGLRRIGWLCEVEQATNDIGYLRKTRTGHFHRGKWCAAGFVPVFIRDPEAET